MVKNEKVLYWRARWAIKRKRHWVARRRISRLLEINPHNDDAWVLAAAVTSDSEKKNDYLKLALRLNLDNEEANKAYREIDPTAFSISILSSRKQRISERINQWYTWHFIALVLLITPLYTFVWEISTGINQPQATPIWTRGTQTPVVTPVPQGVQGEVISTELISVGLDDEPANGASRGADISADGQVVVFSSSASNLVEGDINTREDVFVHDRITSEIHLVSVSSAGEQGNDRSYDPAISANGRFVTFTSSATNLVENDENDEPDIFIVDLETMEVKIVSLGPESKQLDGESKSSDVSADGRFIVFASDTNHSVNDVFQIMLFDQQTDQGHVISKSADGFLGDGDSISPSISNDGRYIAFESRAHNLFPNDADGYPDIYLYKQNNQSLRNITAQQNRSSHNPILSGNGQYIIFESFSNMSGGNGYRTIYRYQLLTSRTRPVSVDAQGDLIKRPSTSGSISDDGAMIGFLTSGISGLEAAYVRDFQHRKTELIAKHPDGSTFNGDLSEATLTQNGCCVVIETRAAGLLKSDTNGLLDVFLVEFR